MATNPVTPPSGSEIEWSARVGEAIRSRGAWITYRMLAEARQHYPSDLALRGYIEIVRNLIVKELLSHPKGIHAVPKLSPEFLSNFDQFNLNAQEGYLISLIDGRFDLQKLLQVAPFDAFTTLFNLARLHEQRAIVLPE
jgi:hypothetical protein